MPPSAHLAAITEGGAATNVMAAEASADFYIRHRDEVNLVQMTAMVDNAARAAASATGTRVKIDHHCHDRNAISDGSIGEIALACMKKVRRRRSESRARLAAGLPYDRERVERGPGRPIQRQTIRRA